MEGKWSYTVAQCRKNGYVTELASLMEGEWSFYQVDSLLKGEWLCYRGGQFNGGSTVMLQIWLV